MKKIIAVCALFLAFFYSSTFAEEYIFFYGNWCPHCANVEKFFSEEKIEKKFDITSKEIYFNRDNLKDLNYYLGKLNLSIDSMGIPFLVITSWWDFSYLNGDKPIIDFFTRKLNKNINPWTWIDAGWTCLLPSGSGGTVCSWVSDTTIHTWIITTEEEKSWFKNRLSFFAIMLPAAISDSINPCAFAVMLLLLSAILSKHKSRRKTFLAWCMFALAVFLSYLAMGIWLFSALAWSSNTFVLKLIVWVLWILVWLANIKDYFWYGKLFVMEVPFSRRWKMSDMIDKVSSPWWAFFVGILVSLFLLPCSSWPYFTILWYLSSESKTLTNRWYIYLVVYNLIFILPMLIIAWLVGFGYSTVDKLAKIKHQNTKLIHLVVGLLMLGLGIYVLTTI
ncbi:MAG: cytochrome c biogenesis protein transmembrane region [uncultured bacterium (gcode 4)]|uniref:Cytochrome c biogenesis protein transmembrane region n=1 Tax=uncultured bacterium (gcode 4) TaxID=1234023 RepID=K1XIS1_9BACT|nr:MAG: cytochrome c biogenesis protein transmembrane region [uncultured bacterium (gcode 4)]